MAALAVALVVASETWSRLIAAGIVATVLTFVSQASWHGVWIWWAPMMALLALTLLLARVRAGPGARLVAPIQLWSAGPVAVGRRAGVL